MASVEIKFSFSTGLAKDVVLPDYVFLAIEQAKQRVTRDLKLTKDSKWDFRSTSLNDVELCNAAKDHNAFINLLFMAIESQEENKKRYPGRMRTLTPTDASEFWWMLREIEVPVERWTSSYYTSRMNAFYEAMRGRSSEGVSMGEPFSKEQASSVIWYLAEILRIDRWDQRLEVCRDDDHLTPGDEYDWCEDCGAVRFDNGCDKKLKSCPLRDGSDDEDDTEELTNESK